MHFISIIWFVITMAHMYFGIFSTYEFMNENTRGSFVAVTVIHLIITVASFIILTYPKVEECLEVNKERKKAMINLIKNGG